MKVVEKEKGEVVKKYEACKGSLESMKEEHEKLMEAFNESIKQNDQYKPSRGCQICQGGKATTAMANRIDALEEESYK